MQILSIEQLCYRATMPHVHVWHGCRQRQRSMGKVGTGPSVEQLAACHSAEQLSTASKQEPHRNFLLHCLSNLFIGGRALASGRVCGWKTPLPPAGANVAALAAIYTWPCAADQ